jgi:Zn-finger nucleic acid-binding protein
MNASDATTCNRNQVVEPCPRCALTGCLIVNRLPTFCPLRERKPGDALFALQKSAVNMAANGDEGTKVQWAHFDICNKCYGVLIANPTVAKLRAACATTTKETPHTTERRADSSVHTYTSKRSRRKVTYFD